jgi:prepilin-type N-terminal cleavage/methylation domain-containing protein
MNQNLKNQKGFTLIEILVVIGMIALLAAIVLIAINPSRQFAQGRNSQRHNDASAILNAVGQYIADNKAKDLYLQQSLLLQKLKLRTAALIFVLF